MVPGGALPRGQRSGVIFSPSVLGAAAAGGLAGRVSGHLARGMSRSEAGQPGDFIAPGQVRQETIKEM